jgi:hypothetical protein
LKWGAIENMFKGKLSQKIVVLFALVLCAGTWGSITHVVAQSGSAQSTEQSRGLWVEEFMPVRRKSSRKSATPVKKYVAKSVRPIPVPSAQKTGDHKAAHQALKGHTPLVLSAIAKLPGKRLAAAAPANFAGRTIGITFWRLRPARPKEVSRRITQAVSGGEKEEWVPERIEAETRLVGGDKVRVSIESPDAGYLYVINSEYYADGSVGVPFLIFPSNQIRNGDNRIEPGQLVDIPAQSDPVPWFDVEAGDQVAELLTIIVSKTRLGINIGSHEPKLDWRELLKWNDSWGAGVERLEQVRGAGQAWTDAEQEAGSDLSRRITQANPLPQTIYHVYTKPGDPLMLTVPLAYGNFATRQRLR